MRPRDGAAREQELQVGLAFNPETEPEAVLEFADAVDLVLCMSIHPGYSGQAFMPEALGRIAELRGLSNLPIQVDGGVGETNARAVREAGASLLVCGNAIFADPDPAAAYRRLVAVSS